MPPVDPLIDHPCSKFKYGGKNTLDYYIEIEDLEDPDMGQPSGYCEKKNWCKYEGSLIECANGNLCENVPLLNTDGSQYASVMKCSGQPDDPE